MPSTADKPPRIASTAPDAHQPAVKVFRDENGTYVVVRAADLPYSPAPRSPWQKFVDRFMLGLRGPEHVRRFGP